jgi:MarR family transcriptional regulator, temperature-dependent positive regulator of motility
MPSSPQPRSAGNVAQFPGSEHPARYPMIATKLWENPCWFSFRINYLALLFNLPVYGWIERRYEMARPEYVVLYSLGLKDAISANDICQSSGFPKNTLSRAIQKLLQRRLIRRAEDASDRRRYVLRLTAEGKRIVNETLPPMLERERRMLETLNNDEQQVLSKLLARLVSDSPNWPSQIEQEESR